MSVITILKVFGEPNDSHCNSRQYWGFACIKQKGAVLINQAGRSVIKEVIKGVKEVF